MFVLNPGSGVPIYRQLVEQVKRMVAGGQLKPGDALPSVRELAGSQAVNPMTVSKAYNQLEAEGILLRKRGRPMEVAPLRANAEDPISYLRPQLLELLQASSQLGIEPVRLPDVVAAFIEKEKNK